MLIHGDATEEILSIPDASYDLVFLDPDYHDWADLIAKGFLDQALRVLRPNGNIVCFTKQPFDFELRCALQPILRRQIIWSFSNGGAWCSPNLPLISHQLIYWASPSKQPFFQARTGQNYSQSTKAFTRSNKVFGGYNEEGKDFIPSEEGTWMRDHYHFNKPLNGLVFEKPLELVTILLKCLCPANGDVLDPFGGSGTTMRAAASLGMNPTTIERDDAKIQQLNSYIDSRLFL